MRENTVEAVQRQAPLWDGKVECREERKRVPLVDHDHRRAIGVRDRIWEMGARPGEATMTFRASPDITHMLIGSCCRSPHEYGARLECDPTLPPNALVLKER